MNECKTTLLLNMNMSNNYIKEYTKIYPCKGGKGKVCPARIFILLNRIKGRVLYMCCRKTNLPHFLHPANQNIIFFFGKGLIAYDLQSFLRLSNLGCFIIENSRKLLLHTINVFLTRILIRMFN